MPIDYSTVVDALPNISPPQDYGTGHFTGDDDAIAIREVAEELADELVERGLKKCMLSRLIVGTSLEGVPEELLERTFIPGLKSCRDVLVVRKLATGYIARLPEPAAPVPSSAVGSESDVLFSFFD